MMPFGLNQERLSEIRLEKQRAEIERLRTWLGDSEMTVGNLRAALERILAIDPMTQDVLTDDRFDVACGIARKALKSAPADETASATSPATFARLESDK